MVNISFLYIIILVFLSRVISATKSSLKEYSNLKHFNLYEPIVIHQYYQCLVWLLPCAARFYMCLLTWSIESQFQVK